MQFGCLGCTISHCTFTGGDTVLAAHKDQRTANPLMLEQLERLACHEEVTCRQNINVLLPHCQCGFFDDCATSNSDIVNHHVDATIGQHGLFEAVDHRIFTGHIG